MKRFTRVVCAALVFALLCGLCALPAAADEKSAAAEQAAALAQKKLSEAINSLGEANAVINEFKLEQEQEELPPPPAEEPFPEKALAQLEARAVKAAGGNFMRGMCIQPGARGENIELLILALHRWESSAEGITKHLSNYVKAQKSRWYNKLNPLLTDERILRDAAKKHGYRDLPQEKFLFCSAVRELKQFLTGESQPEPPFTDVVGAQIWRALGLEIKPTFEAAFGKPGGGWVGGGASPIKMKLERDTLTFVYSPKFYVTRKYKDNTLSDGEVAEIIENCVAGFKGWEGTYEVYGQALTVAVEVHPGTAAMKLFAGVKVVPYDGTASRVLGCIVWRPWSPLLQMSIRSGSGYVSSHTAKHEFGHVLGLFDAYGYGMQVRGQKFLGIDLRALVESWLPEAPADRATRNSIMRSRQEVTPTEIEMLLWAWKSSRLQLYTESILTWLGAQVSPAFWY